jgi:signal transduction histidine kinase
LRLLHPLRLIADEANDISARNLTRRIHSGTGEQGDEWYYLADTLNQLLNRLQESFEIQGRFIANASHELSTPLTSISSQLEVSLTPAISLIMAPTCLLLMDAPSDRRSMGSELFYGQDI